MFIIKEWYLITPQTRPNLIGGYENDSFVDYKEDAFSEVLATNIASTVILYNYDLSKSKKIRCVIQDNTADTQLKSMERNGLFSIDTVKAGMYIFFEGSYWLITGRPGTNGVYEKAALQLCQYKLRWQNEKGKIIERWCSATSASKYNVGETSNKTITLTTDDLTLLLPDDDDSMELDGKRVFIDRRKIPKKVYKITRDDNVLYDYGIKGGIISFIADKTELNPSVDNQELRLCDYRKPHFPLTPKPYETTNLFAKIVGKPTMDFGFSRTYAVRFADKTDCDLDYTDFKWNVISDFEVKQAINGNQIELLVDNEDCIGSSFLLQVIDSKGTVLTELKPLIVEGF